MNSPGFHQFSPGFEISPSFHQKKLGEFTRFSPGFHQKKKCEFTRFSPGFEISPSFHPPKKKTWWNSPGFHQVFTQVLKFHQVFKFHQGEFHTRFSTKFSPGEVTKFSPGFHQVVTLVIFFFKFTAKTDKFHQKNVQNASFGEFQRCKTLLDF